MNACARSSTATRDQVDQLALATTTLPTTIPVPGRQNTLTNHRGHPHLGPRVAGERQHYAACVDVTAIDRLLPDPIMINLSGSSERSWTCSHVRMRSPSGSPVGSNRG